MSQIQISTIHKFAISLLQRDCMRMGLAYDSQVSSETYNRKELLRNHTRGLDERIFIYENKTQLWK